jgi:hypothetical protein
MRTQFGLTIWLLPLFLTAPGILAAEEPVTVSVDASRTIDAPLHLWGYVNVSRRAPPPVELCARIEQEYGRPEVTRCWLMLDEMWDYRTDAYRFNYEINKNYYEGDPNKRQYGVVGTATGLRYYDYLDSVSGHSETVMMNIRRYEQEVLAGVITWEKWKDVFKAAVRHYKQRCPNLRYIEVLNEPTAKNQSNLGNLRHYYDFYRQAYEAINELNAELQPRLPLLVGGSSGFRTTEAIHLIKDFARDPSPDKKLDFVSFHHYWLQKTPAEIAGWEAEIDLALAKASLPTDLPIFVTEIGYAYQWKNDPEKNLWQAVGMTAFQYFARQAQDLRLFPWVQYHSLEQIAFVQFDPKMRMTPFGAAVKMQRMHKAKEVAAASSGLDSNGNGVGVLATQDDTGLVVQVWNLRPGGTSKQPVDISITGLPQHLRDRELQIRRYQIDTEHSNCLAMPNTPGGLALADEHTRAVQTELRLSVDLEPMSLVLWTIVAP